MLWGGNGGLSCLGRKKSGGSRACRPYVCAILQGMARFLLQGGRVAVPEQRIARQCCRQQQRQSSQEAGMVIQAGDAGSPTWGRVGSCQRRGGVACERYLKEDAVELGNGLSVGSAKKNQILGKLPSSWLEGRNEDSHFLDSSLPLPGPFADQVSGTRWGFLCIALWGRGSVNIHRNPAECVCF